MFQERSNTLASTIGIKIANGEFYPILEENSQEKKRLVLTTVHDDQRSIQIDLYRSSSQTMTDALYIGSLVMEKIKSQPKGQPSIEFVIASSKNGNITAETVDLDVGTEGRQTLSVSLKSLDEAKQDYVITDLSPGDGDDKALPKGLYEPPVGEIKRKKTWMPKVIITVIILILVALLIWLLLFYCKSDIGVVSRIREMLQGPQVSGQTLSQAAAPPAVLPPPAPP